jgi:putative SOS response-associated peptidase YedK
VRLTKDGQRELTKRSFLSGRKTFKDTAKMISAQSETWVTKSAFREVFKARRCLVVADGFYEWPRLISLRDDEPFAFADL